MRCTAGQKRRRPAERRRRAQDSGVGCRRWRHAGREGPEPSRLPRRPAGASGRCAAQNHAFCRLHIFALRWRCCARRGGTRRGGWRGRGPGGCGWRWSPAAPSRTCRRATSSASSPTSARPSRVPQSVGAAVAGFCPPLSCRSAKRRRGGSGVRGDRAGSETARVADGVARSRRLGCVMELESALRCELCEA